MRIVPELLSAHHKSKKCKRIYLASHFYLARCLVICRLVGVSGYQLSQCPNLLRTHCAISTDITLLFSSLFKYEVPESRLLAGLPLRIRFRTRASIVMYEA